MKRCNICLLGNNLLLPLEVLNILDQMVHLLGFPDIEHLFGNKLRIQMIVHLFLDLPWYLVERESSFKHIGPEHFIGVD